MKDIASLKTFGEVSAEEDSVLDFFVETSVHKEIAAGTKFLVVGRKGSGKTALVRYFSENPPEKYFSSAVRFTDYPWNIHATRIDRSAGSVEAYTASWYYLMAVEFATLVYRTCRDKNTPSMRLIKEFLTNNYGDPEAKTKEILSPERLRVEGTFEPQLFGFKLGSIKLTRGARDLQFGNELNAVSAPLLRAAGDAAAAQLIGMPIFLHLDDLDLGLSILDDSRKAMLVGLVLAARKIVNQFREQKPRLVPMVYLRTDIWESLEFSNKNKITETQMLSIEWTADSLRKLIERRAEVGFGCKVTWDDIYDGKTVRDAQAKWNYILARTYLRPRDVIKFCNLSLAKAKEHRQGSISKEAIYASRDPYSTYLKRELDDEIIPHWRNWSEALDAFSAIKAMTLSPRTFDEQYDLRRTDSSPSAKAALEMLFRFSVLGYQARSGYGGSSWIFKYMSSDRNLDRGATLYKVHQGLKEYCRLKDKRYSFVIMPV